MNVPDLIKEKIVRFADLGKNTDGGVLFLNGDWGTGKTYFWKNLVQEKKLDQIYISLFGIKDLADIKATIFSAFVAGPDSKTFVGKARNFAAKSNILKKGADFAGIDLDIDVVEFATSRKIFCFDDLERLSKSAEIEEILGFINYLSEHKAHRCLIIMNSKEMSDEHRTDLGKLQEKLSMVQVEFGVNIRERTKSFLASKETEACHLKDEADFFLSEISRLEVSNLRVIKRILDILFELKDLLKQLIPDEVIKFVICFVVAESKKIQNDFSFYSFNPMKFLMSNDESQLSDIEKEQKAFYEKYFGKSSPYRSYLTVIKLAKHGYSNLSDLKQEIYGSDDARDAIAKRINELRNVHMFFCTDAMLLQLQTEIAQIASANRSFTFGEVSTLIRTLSSTIKLLEQELPAGLTDNLRKISKELSHL